MKLIAAGLNDCEIARRTGIPRKTVWQWRRMPGVRPRSTTDSSGRCTVHDFAALPAKDPHARAARNDRQPQRQLRRRRPVLEPLAVLVPPTRARPEAPSPHRS
ncbi:helix-turn-helix domain-containing protein [Mycolicibacterium fortuitum]|uniref:helix-turn-helix domain-containing protein n=1 Tax=Mycolicibacterium fortuitum TaxID=1766 RepID=UPI0030132908